MHCAHVNEFIQCFAHGCFKCSLCLANPEGECHIEYNDLISIWKFNMKARCHDCNRYYKITHYNKHRLAQHPIPQIGNYKFNMILIWYWTIYRSSSNYYSTTSHWTK